MFGRPNREAGLFFTDVRQQEIHRGIGLGGFVFAFGLSVDTGFDLVGIDRMFLQQGAQNSLRCEQIGGQIIDRAQHHVHLRGLGLAHFIYVVGNFAQEALNLAHHKIGH